MPELPEVESLRRSLTPSIVGRRVEEVIIVRYDICESRDPRGLAEDVFLQGDVVRELTRRGKQLAIHGERGRVLCIGLGMTGAIEIHKRGDPIQRHTHVQWLFDDDQRMDFIDPRRFGGIAAYVDSDQLMRCRWNRLGPDALDADARAVNTIASKSRRSVKAVLLDQSVIAGVGNIYADESLFRSGVDPRKKANRLDLSTWGKIVENVKVVLRQAIDRGGSTIRDYRRSDGSPGSAQEAHKVYGRGGEPCVQCGSILRTDQVAQRTTVWCAQCQRR